MQVGLLQLGGAFGEVDAKRNGRAYQRLFCDHNLLFAGSLLRMPADCFAVAVSVSFNVFARLHGFCFEKKTGSDSWFCDQER